MTEPTVEVFSNLILENDNTKSSIEDTRIKTVPLDPFCTTYEMDGYWLKIIKGEVKNPNYTPLHREKFVLDTIDSFNRKTADLKLHIPITKALAVGSSLEGVEKPFLLVRAVQGVSLLKIMMQNSLVAPADVVEKSGKDIGTFLARIHAIPAKGCGLFSPNGVGVHPGPWQKYFNSLMEAQWNHLRESGVVESHVIDKLAQLSIDSKGVMVGETVALCHNDFQYSNMLVDEESRKLTGLVNYGQAGVSSPMADISSIYMHCSDSKLWQKIAASYENIRSFPDKFDKKLPYYSFVFGLRAAWFFHMRKDEQSKGYYLRRAFEEAAKIDDSFAVEASKYSSFAHPSIMGG